MSGVRYVAAFFGLVGFLWFDSGFLCLIDCECVLVLMYGG